MAKKPKGQKKPGRIRQVIQAYHLTRPHDRWLGWILLATFVFGSLVSAAVFTLLTPTWLWLNIVLGLFMGLMIMLIVFGRRATNAQLNEIEGKPGAALAVLRVLKRGWRTDQMVAFNKQQDLVHRLVGPPGIVLLGEGDPTRVRQLLANETRRHQRVAADTPVHQVVVGYGEDEVPLKRLARHVRKMKRQIKPAEMTDVLNRLKAIDASRPNVPMPKGPVPTSMKGMRGQMRSQMRGR